MAAVQPVRGVREQQVARALQDRLHPPAQPVPGVERAPVAGALFAEAVAVAVHVQQRRRGVDAQRVQPEPGVRHAGVLAHGRPELLLGLRIRAHRVGVHAPQPGEVGRGLRALRTEVHQVPHKRAPRMSRRSKARRITVPWTGIDRTERHRTCAVRIRRRVPQAEEAP